jgi:hypothetical protein
MLINISVPKNRVSRPMPPGVQHRHQDRQAHGHRHEEEVVDARRRELNPGQVQLIHDGGSET